MPEIFARRRVELARRKRVGAFRNEVKMHPCRVVILICVLCASCSPKPGRSFGFSDGKPIHVIREKTKEDCLRAAEASCRGGFAVLEEGPAPARHRGGWVEPERRQVETAYSMRVKCDDH